MHKQIMVVDDDVNILALVDFVLKRHGFTVVKASGSKDALDALNSTSPDLFIVDFMMPDMDGIELCRMLRSRPQSSDKPIIVFSASDSSHLVEKFKAAGADAFLEKVALHTKLASSVKALLKM